MKKPVFTPAVAYRLIEKAKTNFNRHPYAPKEWKDVFNKLHMFVAISEKISGYPAAWAMAWMLNDYHGKACGIDPLAPKTKVGKREWWLCLEFQAQKVCTADGPSLFNLVTHEVAHCLDYVIRGKMQAPDESHDEFFKVLMGMMGGTEDYRFPHYGYVTKRIEKSIDSFHGESIVAE